MYTSSASGKSEEKNKLVFFLPVVGFIFDISIMNSNLWSVTKNVLGVNVVSKEIECADRIVYGTGI